jgi:hypothetical protein
MINNNGRFTRGTGAASYQPQRARVPETTFLEREIQAERKQIKVKSAENTGGKLMRITEIAGGRRDQIVFPLSSYKQVAAAILEAGEAAEKASEAGQPAAAV